MNVMRKCVLVCGVVLMIVGCDAKIETTVQPSQPAKPKVNPIEQRANSTQVSVTLRLSEAVVRPGDKFEVAVEMKIAPMWEIHPLAALPTETATKLELITPEGMRAESEWIEPKTARSMGASGQPVHMGKAVFKRSLAIDSMAPGEYEIICEVGYQVCNEQQCLKPETLTLSVPLMVRE
jgi:hypothetical protein